LKRVGIQMLWHIKWHRSKLKWPNITFERA
jgi:hypothetical protein